MTPHGPTYQFAFGLWYILHLVVKYGLSDHCLSVNSSAKVAVSAIKSIGSHLLARRGQAHGCTGTRYANKLLFIQKTPIKRLMFPHEDCFHIRKKKKF